MTNRMMEKQSQSRGIILILNPAASLSNTCLKAFESFFSSSVFVLKGKSTPLISEGHIQYDFKIYPTPLWLERT